MKEVLVIQHVGSERLGIVAQALRETGIGFVYCRPYLGEPLPRDLSGYLGLVILGGPQGVYEEDKYPYLAAEQVMLRQALDGGLPVLGVCLGSQILASALGADVAAGGYKEIGWEDIRLASGAQKDPHFEGFPPVFPAFHWHGDVYDLPHGTALLLSSAKTPVQGFRAGHNVYGLLCHLEVTCEQIGEMVQAFPEELSKARVTPEQVLKDTARYIEGLQRYALPFYRRWARLV